MNDTTFAATLLALLVTFGTAAFLEATGVSAHRASYTPVQRASDVQSPCKCGKTATAWSAH